MRKVGDLFEFLSTDTGDYIIQVMMYVIHSARLLVFREHESPTVIPNVYLQSSSHMLGHPVLYAFPDKKKLCSFPPSVVVVFFFCFCHSNSQNPTLRGRNTTTVRTIVTSVVGMSILVPW